VFNAKVFRQCKSAALQKTAVSSLANRHSLLATVLPFASRHSLPFFPDLPICRPHDLPKTRLGKSPALPFSLAPFEIRYLARPLNFAQSFPK
jgi:hypothetical protein